MKKFQLSKKVFVFFTSMICLQFYFSTEAAASEINAATTKLLIEKAKNTQTGVLLILQDNKSVVEQNWDGPQTFYSIQSISKSVLGLVYGDAIEQKKINLTDKANKWIPEWKDRRSEITIEELMTHTAGYFEPTNFGIFEQPNMVDFAKKLQLKFLPGSTFSYSNSGAILLGDILKSATKKSAEENFKTVLFSPLRIEKWSFDKDQKGNYITSGGLKLRSHDLLKIGNMLAHDGQWNGQQVVSSAWIKQMTTPSRKNENYGLLWWLLYANDLKAYYAQGYQGQYIVIIPSKKLVAIRLRSLIPDDQNKSEYDWTDFPKEILDLFKTI